MIDSIAVRTATLPVVLAVSSALTSIGCIAVSSRRDASAPTRPEPSPGAELLPAADDGVAARLERIEERLDRITTELGRLADAQERWLDAAGAVTPRVGDIEVGASPTRGPADAPVTIVAFGDFECAYCASVIPTMERLLAEYDGAIRYVFKHFPMPFHKKAVLAHRVAIAAGEEGKFWEMHRRLYESQDRLAPDDLRQLVEEIDLDLGPFDAFAASNERVDVIREDRLLARELGVRGVPSFFINGRFIAGAQPYEVFRGVIEEELARPVPDASER